ncbi:TIGR02265 family protein [Archangium lipolyticum]|uniref:TIGR02265 family protein n=1 Tax=Archangium lipolyticum TaxID=2970465 RepID=UPI00214C1D8A|nr:TIGR02265 family protein [Archangium lipolyticum]
MCEVAETGSQQELEQRLALVGPKDTLHGFFFNGALKVVRGLGDAVVLGHCIQAAGGDRFSAFFHYPVGSLTRLLYAAAWALSEAHGGFDAAMRYLGSQVVPDYLESSAGRVLVKLAGGGPKQLLHSLPSVYRTSVQHGECAVRWTGSNAGVLQLAGNILPSAYVEGATRGVFDSLRMPNVKVSGKQVSLSHSEMEISW